MLNKDPGKYQGFFIGAIFCIHPYEPEAVKKCSIQFVMEKMITQNMHENFPFQAKKARATAESKNTPHHGCGQGAAVFLYRNNAVIF